MRNLSQQQEALPRLLDDLAALHNLFCETLMYAEHYVDESTNSLKCDVDRLSYIKKQLARLR